MLKKIFLFAFCVLMLVPAGVLAQGIGEDDFGLWTELGAEKNLPNKFSLGLNGELRTQDNSRAVDRWDIGVDLGYKLNRYVKFGVGYVLLWYYNPEKTTGKYNSSGVYKGFNRDNSHWNMRHRVNIEVTGTVKPCRWLRISLRERYQMTHGIESRYGHEKWRYRIDPETGEKYLYMSESEERLDTASTDHLLRSRLKFEFDKKRCKWSPYVSVEFHNDLVNGMHLDKLRTVAGCDYKINKHHSVGLSYVLTHKFQTGEPTDRMHAMCVSYKYDF